MTESVKMKDGHTIHFEWNGVFVTDDSGDRAEVDTNKDILAYSIGGHSFTIPLVGITETVGPPEEALYLASKTGMKISAGGRRFKVEESP